MKFVFAPSSYMYVRVSSPSHSQTFINTILNSVFSHNNVKYKLYQENIKTLIELSFLNFTSLKKENSVYIINKLLVEMMVHNKQVAGGDDGT